MHFIDLVLQGVRRFDQSRKFPIKPGFNVVFGPTESGKSTLVACILDLLYPDRIRDEEAPFVNWSNPEASRAGLTMASGRDSFRLLKDYKTGKMALSQYNPASQKYEPVASEAAQIASMLASSFDLPGFDVYNMVFVSAPERMPSSLPLSQEEAKSEEGAPADQHDPMQQPQVPGMMSAPAVPGMMSGPALPAPGMPPGQQMPGMNPPAMPGMPGMSPPALPGMTGMPGAPGMPGMPGMQQPDDGMTPEEREMKLKELREELKTAEVVDELQYEIDGLQHNLFDLESKRKSTEQFDEFIEAAKEQLEKYPAFARLPQNMDERLDRYNGLHAMQAKEVEAVDNEALEFEDELNALALYPPLWNQQPFQAGAIGLGVGILLFAATPFLDMSWLRLLGAVVSCAGVVGMVLNAFSHVSRTSRLHELQAKMEELEEKKSQIIKRFEVEMGVINKLMNDTDSDSIDELKNKLQKYRELDERCRAAREKKKKLVKDVDLEKLAREEAELKDKIEKLEEKLRGYPPLSMDINTMRKEIKRLEKVIRATNPNSPLLKEAEPEKKGAGLDVPEVGAPSPADSRGDSSGTRVLRRKTLHPHTASQTYEQLIQASAKLLQTERNKLIRHVQDRLNLYIQAFFNKRYREVRIEPDGSIALKDASAGRWVDFENLTPAARDTAYLALQITLLELAIQRKSLPVILDNPIGRLDETAAIIAAKALKRVSERSQVILLCSQRAPVQQADNSLELS